MTSFAGFLIGFGFLEFGFGHELKKHAKDDWSGLTQPLFGSWTGIETSGPYSIAMYEGWPSVPGGLGTSSSAAMA